MKKTSLFLVVICSILILSGCNMGTYTISTSDVKRIATGDFRIAGISFVNNTKLTMDVQLGPLGFKIPPGEKVEVAYSAIFQRNRNLNIEVIVTSLYNVGKVRGARTSWDYSQWYDPYGNWQNISERVVLIELNPEGNEIWLR